MKRLGAWITAAFDALVARHGGYMKLGPIYVTSWNHTRSDSRNAFEIGREWERAHQAGKV